MEDKDLFEENRLQQILESQQTHENSTVVTFVENHNGKPVRFLEYNNRLFVDTDDIDSLLDTTKH